ncbi:hypothetical protein KC640_01780 [Candidatus Dojkabacteria bacterium]|uniref:Uncharacterized protein n=1 Tax=Candidatus Dojkabacteria bacterium TaxID=2099670 RepID=A0A955I4Y2_9BACT|nr:hypothetical protein [Candidatus Dojkabacteria bacterium]
MTKRLSHGARPAKFYTALRILSILSINLLIIVTFVLINFVLLISVKSQEGLNYWSYTQLAYLMLFIISCLLVAYGSGMYVTAIASEIYVLKRMKKDSGFSVLNMAHKLFHGPLSHVFMFSGGIFLFITISLMESTIPISYLQGNSYLMPAYLLVGVVLGIVIGIVTVKDMTWEHQIPWTIMEFLLLLFIVVVNQLDLSVHLFTLTTLFAIVMVNITYLFKIIHANYRGEHYTYARFIPDFIDHDPGEHDV